MNRAQILLEVDALLAAARAEREQLTERRLGLLQIGQERIEAVSGDELIPTLRRNGREVVRFSLVGGHEEAEHAAERAFQRIAERELGRARTPEELKARIWIHGVKP